MKIHFLWGRVFKFETYYVVGFLIDVVVIALALVGNKMKSKTMYHPFFAVHASFNHLETLMTNFQLIMEFFLSVIAVLLFIKVYERNEVRRNTYPPISSISVDTSNKIHQYDYSGPLLLSYIMTLLVHGYALKVIYRHYQHMAISKTHNKTNINALKVLINREREVILARAANRPVNVWHPHIQLNYSYFQIMHKLVIVCW